MIGVDGGEEQAHLMILALIVQLIKRTLMDLPSNKLNIRTSSCSKQSLERLDLENNGQVLPVYCCIVKGILTIERIW